MIRLDSGEPLETAMRDGQLASSKIVPDDVSRCDYENAGPGGRMDARRRDAQARLVAAVPTANAAAVSTHWAPLQCRSTF